MNVKEAYEKGKQAALAGKNLYSMPNYDILPDEIKNAWVKGFEDNTKKPQYKKIGNSFQNGRIKAFQAITNKAMSVGVKLENWNGQDINLSTGKKITHKRAENGSWDSSPSMSEEEYKEYIQKRKQIK